MRRSSLRLYGPFLAIALVQGLFIAIAPSNAPERSAVGTFGSAPGALGGSATIDPETGQVIDPATGEVIDPATGAVIDPATGQPAGGSAGGATGGGATGTGGGGGATAAAGDTSHCVGDRQFEILLNNPPCVAKFPEGADNGGATYQGVTKDKVRVVFFSSEPNAAVDAALAPQGLAASEQQLNDVYKYGHSFIEEHYELYGRKLEIIRITGNCPTSPPDVPACKEAAREVIKLKPFLVVWATPLYGEVFDEWARAGIISIGGWHFDESYFTQRRPFRYDLFMDGTQSADMIAEYYCKKMAKGKADHAGPIIHNSFPNGGRRELVRRKLGITVPEIDANLRTAIRVQQKVKACDGVTPVIQTYVSDIERAQEQTDATTQKMIREQVTTTVCMCDPIAPIFGTAGFTSQRYFPEILMPGLGLLDFDKLGRLYDNRQMEHAFGPGHLADPIAHNQTDVVRVFKDQEAPRDACASCNLPWGYLASVASFLQGAGPNLNPLTVEKAVLSAQPFGGDKPGTQLIKFGANDYTGLSDAREIYWNASATSKIDGQPGAYVAVGGPTKRYELGEWPGGLSQIPIKPT